MSNQPFDPERESGWRTARPAAGGRPPLDQRLDDDRYQAAVPGSGYFPPETPSSAGSRATPASGGMARQGRRAWQGYHGLRQRARHNSMSWWGLKVIQGALIGGIIAAMGLGLAVAFRLVDGAGWVASAGLVTAVVGLIVFARYTLAPLTCRWIVIVPENHYFVVEDFDGYTVEYLGPGRMIVPWRWQTRVRPYVNFNYVTVTEIIEDVLNSLALPISIEVAVHLDFDPVRALPQYFAQMRRFREADDVQRLVGREVCDIVRVQLNRLVTADQSVIAQQAGSLEVLIADQLQERAAMGLFLTSSRPVSVYLRAPKQVGDVMQAMLWGGALPRTIPGQQMVADVRGLAARLNLTDEQAYQLYQIFIQSGGQLRPGTGPLGPLPPTYVIPPTTPPPQAPPQVPPQTPPPRTTPPDPLAMRRQRRQRRHDDD